MVVDDDPYQTFTIKKSLEIIDNDYEVIRADSGMQCLELLKNKKIPDIILLDIMMPDMNGWKVYKKLRENQSWKNIPIIFITARTDQIAKNAGNFYGEDYIEKPFEIVDLKKRIDKVIKNKINNAQILIEEKPWGQAPSADFALRDINDNEEVLIAACDNAFLFNQDKYDKLKQRKDVDMVM